MFSITRLRLRVNLGAAWELAPILSRMVATAEADSPHTFPILLIFSPASKCHKTSSFPCRLTALRSHLVLWNWLALGSLFRGIFRPEMVEEN